MALLQNIQSYVHGSRLLVSATLTRAGAPLTSGTVTMRIGLTNGGPEALEIAGAHTTGGVWTFEATAAQMAVIPEGDTGFYTIWEDVSDDVLAYGSIRAIPSIADA